jgi:hypothetical protein
MVTRTNVPRTLALGSIVPTLDQERQGWGSLCRDDTKVGQPPALTGKYNAGLSLDVGQCATSSVGNRVFRAEDKIIFGSKSVVSVSYCHPRARLVP